ncbi:type II toxin-antitoxin system HicB family antitoxin [Bombella sp. TMW 2.2559]|uniref:Type II toxin-antitoxin system HicB family antitoxin n=1 Tax=Bombella dulcis TaxID=2967339 RepID=A0ABT3WCZ8_9PROT|nr:type II toxin-antitoxin system HicB family antitoxin [Bombella dulcis]MCX5615689.1 type II toxin-antitoxin system HicB family antitoxin [Bombella dulcis]
MKNTMTINGYQAVIEFDPDAGLFRGEFIGLNDGADFYAKSVKDLQKEGGGSLHIFMKMCKEKGISPIRHYSGTFQVRLSEKEHARAVKMAAARGISLNQLIRDSLAGMET